MSLSSWNNWYLLWTRYVKCTLYAQLCDVKPQHCAIHQLNVTERHKVQNRFKKVMLLSVGKCDLKQWIIIVSLLCLFLMPFFLPFFPNHSAKFTSMVCQTPMGQEALQSNVIVLSSVPKLTVMKYDGKCTWDHCSGTEEGSIWDFIQILLILMERFLLASQPIG